MTVGKVLGIQESQTKYKPPKVTLIQINIKQRLSEKLLSLHKNIGSGPMKTRSVLSPQPSIANIAA